MATVTIVGGGLGGLVAAIECAERGLRVELLEARRQLGGRARTLEGPFKANLGSHVMYDDGFSWRWLSDRDLLGEVRRSPLTGVHFRVDGKVRRTPPVRALKLAQALTASAPDERPFREWLGARCGSSTADTISSAAAVFTFDYDPGRLAASFVLERVKRVVTPPPGNRYFVGGWGALVDRLAARAEDLGVEVQTEAKVDEVPPAPAVLAVPLVEARRLLNDDALLATGTEAVLLDVGLRSRRGDPFVVFDFDGGVWVERFSAADATLAPPGHDLIQAHVGRHPGEQLDAAVARIETLLDAGFPQWRDREVWRRRQLMRSMTGALDLPGATWRDRPAIDRGDGVLLVGDMVAAPGLLSEVTFASAVEAAEALAAQRAPVPARDDAADRGHRSSAARA